MTHHLFLTIVLLVLLTICFWCLFLSYVYRELLKPALIQPEFSYLTVRLDSMTCLISLITSSRREYHWSPFCRPARHLLPHLESSAAMEGLPLSPSVHSRQRARTGFTAWYIRYTGGCSGWSLSSDSGPCPCPCPCCGCGQCSYQYWILNVQYQYQYAMFNTERYWILKIFGVEVVKIR